MKNRSAIYIAILLVSGLVLFLLFWMFSPEEKKKDTSKPAIEKKPNDWREEKLGQRVLDPYGTFIFYQLLKTHFKKPRTLKRNSQYKQLDTVKHERRLYVFVGKNFKTHYKRMNKIMAFVERGNDAFLSADIFPERITSLIVDYFKINRSYYNNVEINFADSSVAADKNYNFRFIYKKKNIYRRWTDFSKVTNYYSNSSSEDTTIRVMERNMVTYNPVYIKFNYGKGCIYLHTVPYCFTNVVMKLERGVEHAERVISYLPDEPLIYDSFINSAQNANSGGSDDGQPHKRTSPLQFILENRSLRWAYYSMLAGLLLYILFKSKRRQKTIPPKESIENTSVAFADTMSKLYLQYGQHKYIVFQQEKNLLNYIRSKYYIHSRNPDDEYIGRVAVKSGIDRNRLTQLFERFALIKKNNHATSNDVVELYAEIDYFYKNSK